MVHIQKKKVSIENSTENVEVFDTAIAIMAGLMIIPAVFAFSNGNMENLNAGPSLMFITIPKVFDSMGLGTLIGILFFILVLFAALTSSIALTECAVSTFQDELGWSRHKSVIILWIHHACIRIIIITWIWTIILLSSVAIFIQIKTGFRPVFICSS